MTQRKERRTIRASKVGLLKNRIKNGASPDGSPGPRQRSIIGRMIRGTSGGSGDASAALPPRNGEKSEEGRIRMGKRGTRRPRAPFFPTAKRSEARVMSLSSLLPRRTKQFSPNPTTACQKTKRQSAHAEEQTEKKSSEKKSGALTILPIAQARGRMEDSGGDEGTRDGWKGTCCW